VSAPSEHTVRGRACESTPDALEYMRVLPAGDALLPRRSPAYTALATLNEYARADAQVGE
jgi:hypothetical protein